MNYDFDTLIPRRDTGCFKHDGMMRDFGSNDLLPMWVADMDFPSPGFVLDAIRHRLEHPVLGYAMATQGYFEAMQQWLLSHYGIQAERRQLHFIPGIVAGIAFAIQAFTQPGDRILVTTPVYPPFLHLPEGGGRVLVTSPLIIRDGRFAIDFDHFAEVAKGCKLFILSNPHNPGGTAWTTEELTRIDEICRQNDIIVIDDEIHADLVLPGYQHTPYPAVGSHCLTFVAPSKTFNIAGLGSSFCYCPDEQLRKQFFGYLNTYEVANGNIFAFVAAEAAFRHGEDWLRQLKEYLAGNVAFAKDYLERNLPEIKAIYPEASFLLWLDFSGFGLTHEQIHDRLIQHAKVALNDGTAFGGSAYRNHFRLNIGCPRSMVEQALNQIRMAFKA